MTHPRSGTAGRSAARHAFRRLGACTALLLVVVTLAIGAHADRAIADTTDPDSEGNLTVDITDGSEPSPTPTTRPPSAPPLPPSPPRRPRPPSQNGPVTADVTQATIPDPTAADDALGDDPAVVGGVLAMGGLAASASPSLGIGNGALTLNFVMRNMSSTTFDSSARFWVDNAFGGRIADIDVNVDDLEPDETRRVQVRFDELGQHVVLHAHVTLTPPTTVEGAALEPISRNTTVAVPPWFSISLISGLGVLSGLGWWLFNPRGLGLRLARFGA